MSAQTLNELHLQKRMSDPPAGNDLANHPFLRRAADRAVIDAIDRHLASLRSGMDESTATCACPKPCSRQRRARHVQCVGSPAHADRDHDLSDTFMKHLDDLREIDGLLLRINRSLTEARGDRRLQEFWRGVERDYHEDACQLARRIGEEAIRLAWTTRPIR